MTKYCLGFAFDPAGKSVVLISKNRPAWQAGKLNGVGGHVEEGETYKQSMVREFREETGVHTKESDWHLYARLFSNVFEMQVFSCFTDKLDEVGSLTDEQVTVIRVDSLKEYAHISNLPWLIGAAIDRRFETGRLHIDAEYRL